MELTSFRGGQRIGFSSQRLIGRANSFSPVGETGEGFGWL